MLVDAEGRLVRDNAVVPRGKMRILWPEPATFNALTFAVMWEAGNTFDLSWLVVKRENPSRLTPVKPETLVPFHPLQTGKQYVFVTVRTRPDQKWGAYKHTYELGGAWSMHRLAGAFSLGLESLFRVRFTAA